MNTNKRHSPFICEKCDTGWYERVISSRATSYRGNAAVIRRRECTSCGARLSTYELCTDALIAIRKGYS